MSALVSVPPRQLSVALDFLRAGGRLVVPSYTRPVILTKRTLDRFEKAGAWLLKEDGTATGCGRAEAVSTCSLGSCPPSASSA